MNRHALTLLINFALIVILAASLIGSPAITGQTGNLVLASTLAETGYIDFSYGTAVKPEPTANSQESKLWWNDGLWWGILFDPATAQYMIYRFDWNNKTWVKTNTSLDSRVDGTVNLQVAVRFDALWDAGSNKLYLASYINQANPSHANMEENWARLYRYSYNTSNNTYSLDQGYPVTINEDKTSSLVLEKDATGRLWITYVSRLQVTGQPAVYKVYVNSTTSTTNHTQWGTPFEMTTFSPSGATVDLDDVSSVIAYGNNVGLMWSNDLDGSFYFAEHPASSSPTADWTVTQINIPNVPLKGNNHFKLVKNSAGQVFAAIKTNNTGPTEPLIGVLARDTNGAFSFFMVSDVQSIDTRPTMVLDESANRLLLFYSSNEAGGIVCYKSIQITSPLSNMQVVPQNCSDGAANAASHFIVSSAHPNIDNATTSKHNITENMGLVVLATDDTNGQVYVQNTINRVFTVTDRNYLPLVIR